MTDDAVNGVVEEKRRSKGRGRGLTSLRSKDNDTKVGPVSSSKEKEVKYPDEVKEEKTSEETKARGTKVRKTKAGYEPYQVKKNRSVNTSLSSELNKNPIGVEREHKQTHSPSQKRNSSSSGSSWKYDHHRINDKYYDKNYEQKSMSSYDQKNKSRTSSHNNNNKRNNYRTYTNKEKQKQSRRKKGGNENVMMNQDRANHRKSNLHENGDIGGLRDKSNVTRHLNDHMASGYLDNDSMQYLTCDSDIKDIPENTSRVAVSDKKYIELYHENKVDSSLSLSNSESENLYVKDSEYDKPLDTLQNIDSDSAIDSSIQSDMSYVTTEVNNLTMEEINIIKEVDNKRRVQGIGILECPCSLSLNGERVGYCDAHELIAEHNETIASTSMLSEPAVSSSDLYTESVIDVEKVEDVIDPIDEIYLTISPIRTDEIESNPPSDEDIVNSEGTAESCNNLESLNENEYLGSNNMVSHNLTNDYVSGSESFNVVGDNSFNSTDVCCDEFPSPITLETSRNIDIENINALFMNLGRRQSYNSFNSSSFDSKINSSCEKSWRSMDDFSPSDLHGTSKKQPTVIYVSSDSSDDEAICEQVDQNNSPVGKIQYNSRKISNPVSNVCSSFSKSDTSLTNVSFSKSCVPSGGMSSSYKDSHPSSHPSLCYDNSSVGLEILKNFNYSYMTGNPPSNNPLVEDAVQNIKGGGKNIEFNVRTNDKLSDRNDNTAVKNEIKVKQNLLYSFSEVDRNESCKYSETWSHRYSEGGEEVCTDIERNIQSSNKDTFNKLGNTEEQYLMNIDEKERSKRQDKDCIKNSKKFNCTASNDSLNRESGGSTSDVKEAPNTMGKEQFNNSTRIRNQKGLRRTISNDSSGLGSSDFKEMGSIKENSSDNQPIQADMVNDSNSKTAGVIMLPSSNYIASYQESTPEKSDRFNRSNIAYEQTTRRHVRFSSQSTDSRFQTSSPKHDDDSYMVREYMNVIKDKQFQLKKLLQRGFQSLESVNVMLEMSEAIQQKFGELIVHNQEYSFRHNFENFLWKLAFYSIIAKFRAFLEDQDVPHAAIQKIGVLYWDFLQNGIQFLDSIIVQLQKQAHFDLNDYLKDPIKIGNCNKQVKFALRSCHLLLIFMGDLERYVSQFLQQEDYRNAKRYYKEAQILTPKNGKSYNQLAVVAVVTKHKLDAVYYYARSLQVSIPFLTAKDRLTAIFQEIQKKASKLKYARKVNSTEDGPNPSNIPNILGNAITKRSTDHLRDEVWIFYRNNQMFKAMLTADNEVIYLIPPPHVLKEKKESPNSAEVQSKLSLKEINRSYMILFLFVHCKLYTNIGLEEFTYVHQETLSDLSTLLRYPKASSIRKENLLKCIVINIFSVHNIMEKNGHEDLIPNTGLDLGIIFGMDMVAVLCKHCVHLFNTKDGITVADQFLPAIRVWIQWLITHSELVRKSTVCAMYDIWSDICEFFNKINSVPLLKDVIFHSEGCENVYLEEDLLLAGLKSLNNPLMYCAPPEGEEREAISQFRLENLISLTKRLEDCGNLPFVLDGACKYKPVLTSIASSSPVKKVKVLDVADEVEVLADVIIEDDDEEFGDMSHVDELKVQKAALIKQIQESEFAREAAMAVLESHRLQGRHLSENSPTFIVADTNCYIDHLDHIDTILKSKLFTIIVPLIVINELDGLKKGSYFDESKFHEHQMKVQESARLAVDFLEDQFSQINSNLRAITSNGNEMDTIVFRVEEFSNDSGTNDDVILSCCLRYCKEHKVRTEEDTNVISREVVLLTNDRNLRVKAHTRVVPTVDISTFIKMAALT